MQECRSYLNLCLAGKSSGKRCYLMDVSFTFFQNYSMKSGIFLAQRRERKAPALMARSHLRRWGVSGLQHPYTANAVGNLHFQFDWIWSKGYRLLWWFGFFVTCLGVVWTGSCAAPPHRTEVVVILNCLRISNTFVV